MSRKQTSSKSNDSTLLMPWCSEAHARTSASPAKEREWMESLVTWPSSPLTLFERYIPAGSSLRTSLDYCRQPQGGTLEPSLGQWQSAGMGGPTECLTLSISVWPSDGSVCSLSDILETGDHLQRYCLTPKACAGILRRAENRGKELPAHLERALQAVVDSEQISK